ncbi:MAG: hypothetical protein K2X93_14655, partial [Candidatus Obscuribacterales bacterium]|nr:hypothetical protein [Candidatus Obscuribacterales bacterium]
MTKSNNNVPGEAGATSPPLDAATPTPEIKTTADLLVKDGLKAPESKDGRTEQLTMVRGDFGDQAITSNGFKAATDILPASNTMPAALQGQIDRLEPGLQAKLLSELQDPVKRQLLISEYGRNPSDGYFKVANDFYKRGGGAAKQGSDLVDATFSSMAQRAEQVSTSRAAAVPLPGDVGGAATGGEDRRTLTGTGKDGTPIPGADPAVETSAQRTERLTREAQEKAKATMAANSNHAVPREEHVQFKPGEPGIVGLQTPLGPRAFNNVTNLDTAYDADLSAWKTELKTNDGNEYQQLRTADGKVLGFTQTKVHWTDANNKSIDLWQKQDPNSDFKTVVSKFKDETGTWSRGQGENSNLWTKVGDDGKPVVENGKPVTFHGDVEIGSDKSVKITNNDTTTVTTRKQDGSSERTIAGRSSSHPEYQISTKPDGTVTMTTMYGGKFSTADNTLTVNKDNGDLSFKDWRGATTLRANGDETSINRVADKTGYTSTTMDIDPTTGDRQLKAFTLKAGSQISGEDMGGNWTRGADGTWSNDKGKTITGKIDIDQPLGLMMVKDTGRHAEGTYDNNGKSSVTFKSGEGAKDPVTRTIESKKDGSKVDINNLLTPAEAKAQVGDASEGRQIQSTTTKDARGVTRTVWVDKATKEAIKAQDETGTYTPSTASDGKVTWTKVADATGKPLDPSEKPTTFQGGFDAYSDGSITKTDETNGQSTMYLADGSQERNIFGEARGFEVKTRADGQIEVRDVGEYKLYSTEPGATNKLTKEANGDLTFTNSQGDKVTVRANGEATTQFAGNRMSGITSITEAASKDSSSRDLADVTFAKDKKINGRDMSGSWHNNGDGTWTRTKDSSGKAIAEPGKDDKFNGSIYVGSNKALGDVAITDSDKHTKETVRSSDGYSLFEQLDATNSKVVTSWEKHKDGSFVRKDELPKGSDERLKLEVELGIKLEGKNVEAVILQDKNGEQTVTWEVSDADGKNRYVAKVQNIGSGGTDTWIRKGDAKSSLWERTDGGNPPDQFYGNVERVADGGIKFSDHLKNQEITYGLDGSSVKTLLTETTQMNSAGQIERVKTPEITIKTGADRKVTLTDGKTGQSYTEQSSTNKLERDPKTGALSFKNRDGQKITVNSDGSRVIADNGGKGVKIETDSGGRLLKQYDANGQLTTEFHYQFKDGKATLDQFQNKDGQWKNTQFDENGKQVWELQNGTNGERLTLKADRIYANRDNSIVIENGNERLIKNTNGTEVREVTEKLPNGQTRVSTEVGGKGEKPAYSLTTIKSEGGQIVSQELKSGAGTFQRGDKPVWEELDSTTGKPKVGSTWAGDIVVTDNGTLIKRAYETGADGSIKRDEGGRNIVRDTTYNFASGGSRQEFASGGTIWRDSDGDVTSRVTASGDVTDIYYGPAEKPGEPKSITGFHENGNYWQYDKESKTFLPDGDKSLIGAQTNVSIDRKNAEIVTTNMATGDKTFTQIDGLTRLERANGTKVFTDRSGKPVAYTDNKGNSFEVEYDNKGKITKVSGTMVNEKGQIVRKLTVLDADNPEVKTKKSSGPGETVIVGTDLNQGGWGERMLQFKALGADGKANGNSIQMFADGTIREFDSSGKVIRSQGKDGVTLVTKDYKDTSGLMPIEDLKKIPGAVIVADSISRVEGTERDQVIDSNKATVYVKDGLTYRRFTDGSYQKFDNTEKLVETRDSAGGITKYSYNQKGEVEKVTSWSAADLKKIPANEIYNGPNGMARLQFDPDTKQPILDKDGIQKTEPITPTQEVGKDKITGKYYLTKTDADGKQVNVPIQSFELRTTQDETTKQQDTRLVVKYPPGSAVAMEWQDPRTGGRRELTSERTYINYDAAGNRTFQRNANDKELSYTYDSSDPTKLPKTISDSSGTWTRGAQSPDKPNEYEWTNAITGEKSSASLTEIQRRGSVADATVIGSRPLEGGSTEKTYDNGSKVIVDKEGNVVKSTDANGTSYTYEREPGSKTPSSVLIQSNDNPEGTRYRVKDGYGTEGTISDIKIGPTGQPIITTDKGTATYEANGIRTFTDGTGLLKVSVNKTELSTGSDFEGSKISSMSLENGNPVLKLEDGRVVRYAENGGKVISDAQGNLVSTVSADGKTQVNYTYSTDADGVKTVSGFTRIVDGKITLAITTNSDGKFSDGTNTYDSLSASAETGQAYLWSNGSKTSRVIDANGNEMETKFQMGTQPGQLPKVLSRVERDSTGLIKLVEDSQHNTTRFFYTNNQLDTIMQGNSVVTRQGGKWVDAARPDVKIDATVDVDRNGKQTWTDAGKPPVVRVVNADGSVEITKPDKSVTIHSADGSSTRHIMPPGSAFREVTQFRDGKVELVKQDGTVLRQTSYSDQILGKGPKASDFSEGSGSIEVTKDGTVTLYDAASKTATIQYTNGSTATLDLKFNDGAEAKIRTGLQTAGLTADQIDKVVLGLKENPLPASAEKLLAELKLAPDSLKSALAATKDAAQWVNGSNKYSSLSEVGAAEINLRDNAFDFSATVKTSSLTRGLDALNPAPKLIEPASTLPTTTNGGKISAEKSNNTSGMNGTFINTQDFNRAVDKILEGSGLTGSNLETAAREIKAHPADAEAILEKLGATGDTAKLSEQITAEQSKVDAARVMVESVLQDGLKGSSLTSAEINGLTQQILNNPANASELLKAKGVDANKADALSSQITAGMTKIDANVQNFVISSTLTAAGLNPQQVANLSAEIKKDPSKAAEILEKAGLQPDTARRAADQIKQDLKFAADNPDIRSYVVEKTLRDAGVKEKDIKLATDQILANPAQAKQILQGLTKSDGTKMTEVQASAVTAALTTNLTLSGSGINADQTTGKVGTTPNLNTNIGTTNPVHTGTATSDNKDATAMAKAIEDKLFNKGINPTLKDKSETIRNSVDSFRKADEVRAERERTQRVETETRNRTETERLQRDAQQRDREQRQVQETRDTQVREQQRRQEQDRVRQEESRVKQEQDRIKQEQERVSKEQERVKTEQDKINKDRDRIKQEQDRIKQDQDRASKDQDRTKQDQDKVKKDQDRLTKLDQEKTALDKAQTQLDKDRVALAAKEKDLGHAKETLKADQEKLAADTKKLADEIKASGTPAGSGEVKTPKAGSEPKEGDDTIPTVTVPVSVELPKGTTTTATTPGEIPVVGSPAPTDATTTSKVPTEATVSTTPTLPRKDVAATGDTTVKVTVGPAEPTGDGQTPAPGTPGATTVKAEGLPKVDGGTVATGQESTGPKKVSDTVAEDTYDDAVHPGAPIGGVPVVSITDPSGTVITTGGSNVVLGPAGTPVMPGDGQTQVLGTNGLLLAHSGDGTTDLLKVSTDASSIVVSSTGQVTTVTTPTSSTDPQVPATNVAPIQTTVTDPNTGVMTVTTTTTDPVTTTTQTTPVSHTSTVSPDPSTPGTSTVTTPTVASTTGTTTTLQQVAVDPQVPVVSTATTTTTQTGQTTTPSPDPTTGVTTPVNPTTSAAPDPTTGVTTTDPANQTTVTQTSPDPTGATPTAAPTGSVTTPTQTVVNQVAVDPQAPVTGVTPLTTSTGQTATSTPAPDPTTGVTPTTLPQVSADPNAPLVSTGTTTTTTSQTGTTTATTTTPQVSTDPNAPATTTPTGTTTTST